MSDEASEDEGDDGVGGFREGLSGFRNLFRSGADNASAYFRARMELLRIEAEEAAETGKSLGVLHGAGFGLLIVGYVLLLLTLVFQFTDSLTPSARLILGGIALVHLLIGAIVLAKGRRRSREVQWFRESREQWKNDRKWIERTLKRSDREKRS